MPVVVGIEVRKNKEKVLADCGNLDLKLGQKIIIETENGYEVGTVCDRERIVEKTDKSISKILRPFGKDDYARLADNETKVQEAMSIVVRKIQDYELAMKLTCLDFTFDRKKLFIYYTADTRVDFRELIKDLGHILKTRIQMVQIGVRDEAQILGGIGHCGRVLCCCEFLKEFKPCTIEMAKEQDIPINVAKLSGVCGRLMCCLGYEHQIYKELKESMPRIGDTVRTNEGKGKVVAAIILTGEVVVEYENNEKKKVKVQDLKK
ncbi:MAG: regulatory iron-sulfur-containing complex subunit RicT [Elusimicrobiota bacterium]